VEFAGNVQEEAVRLSGLKRLSSTIVGNAVPVMFSNAYARIW